MTELGESTELQSLTVDRHDPTILEALQNAPIYQKIGRIKAVYTSGGEIISTVLADGTVETTNTAQKGDVIITNFGGEQYIISRDKFQERYKAVDDEKGIYEAIGQVKAINNPWKRPIAILAPWNSMQIGNADCMIADFYDPEAKNNKMDPYIIAKEEFEQTYTLLKS